MKKVLAGILAIVLLAGCVTKPSEKQSSASTHEQALTITNAVNLVSEKADMSGYRWIRGDVADFQEITMKESIRLFKEGGSGILYYGYVDCPWCNRAVPELNEVAKEMNLTVYYVDASIRVTKEDYTELLSLIDPVLQVDSHGEKGFYVPAIIGVKNGKISDFHVSLLDGFEIPKDEPNKQLDEAQKEELRIAYREIVKKTAD